MFRKFYFLWQICDIMLSVEVKGRYESMKNIDTNNRASSAVYIIRSFRNKLHGGCNIFP